MAATETVDKGWTSRAARLAGRLDDGRLLQAVFFSLLAGTAAILVLDYFELSDAPETVLPTPDVTPVLPAVDRPELDPDNPAFHPAEQIGTPEDTLRQRLSITLESGGALKLQGTIAPGNAEAFAEEIGRLAEYVETVSLDSPGGVVQEALAIGRLIRETGLNTNVGDGALCASSCPLIFAGGVDRVAGEKAVIGVHQIFTGPQTTRINAAQEISNAQVTTAEISRYLSDMEIDPALWLHALETPPDKLYYLTVDEVTAFNLATEVLAAE